MPTLTGSIVVLREVDERDASSLYEALAVDGIDPVRVVAPFPVTPDGFRAFIGFARQRRAQGERICFAAVPRGCEVTIGVFEIWSLEPGFRTAEWRFALAPEFHGSGVFADGARLAIDFLFSVLGAQRLEARADVANDRANGALTKIGAVREAILRGSPGRAGDKALWTIHADDWRSEDGPIQRH